MNHTTHIQAMIALSACLSLAGCGSSNTGTLSEADDTDLTGNLELVVTDAEEDFLTYRIELESISLLKQNGTEVEVLPLATEIDFVQYQELSELFAVLSIPTGFYSSVELDLDYSEAEIVIQDEDGKAYQASAQNSNGDAINKLTVSLSLYDNEVIHISPFKTAQLTLDLDLSASNTIESFTPAVVTVEPFMIGSASLDEDREHRVRGLLSAVDANEQSVELDVIPMRLQSGEFGDFTFFVTDDTVYEIDGLEYSGIDGLSTLSELTTQTPIVAFGQPIQVEAGVTQYTASKVQAGSSVAWADQDILKGTITSRDGDTIYLSGAVIEPNDESAHFRTESTLLVSDQTHITGYELGDATAAHLSVGQRVLALGDYDEVSGVFDAQSGQVRMQLNRVTGTISQPSPLQMELGYMNRRSVEQFDFSGTGVDAANDTDPNRYEVDTQSLDINDLETNEWVQVRGYPTSFGTAPYDFDALSIINPDIASHPARYFAAWDAADSNNVRVTQSLLAIDDSTARSKLHLKGIPGSSILTLNLAAIKSEDDDGRFSILIRGGGIHLYRSYDSFLQALGDYFGNGMGVVHMTASGPFSAEQDTLDANYLTVQLSDLSPSVENDAEDASDNEGLADGAEMAADESAG